MKTINVLYVLTKLELGGAQKICLALHRELIKENHNSTLVSGSEGILKSEAEIEKNCIFIDSLKREISVFGLLNDLKTFFNLIKIIRKIKNEHQSLIVHTHSTKAGIIGRWAAFFAGVHYRVHTVHGFGFHDHQKKLAWFIIVLLEWITTLITTHIICVSKKDLETGARLLPSFAKKSSIIRAAVATEHFGQNTFHVNENNSDIKIGTISCFKPQKNLFDLLEAFKIVRHNLLSQDIRVTLEIIGSGQELEKIEKWIRENNLRQEIILHGWQKNVKPYLNSWDIFALSSLWEGLPCSIVEARLAHLPIVAYDVGGISEIVLNNINGFIIKAGEKNILAERLEELSSNHLLRKKFQLYPDNLQSFSTQSMIQDHENLYKNLI